MSFGPLKSIDAADLKRNFGRKNAISWNPVSVDWHLGHARRMRGRKPSSIMGIGPEQCCHELFELFDYSNSWDRIVVFGIRIRSFFRNRIYSVFSIRRIFKNRIYLVFNIRSNFTIRDNTVKECSREKVSV